MPLEPKPDPIAAKLRIVNPSACTVSSQRADRPTLSPSAVDHQRQAGLEVLNSSHAHPPRGTASLGVSQGVLRPAQSSFNSCVYVALRCRHCGDIRQALAKIPPAESHVCPECSQPCNFVYLGSGLTQKQLPFHELYPNEQTQWARRIDDSVDSS
ncbi:MAG TPA: hypothetical protein VGK24_09240 [Candidatus Angelobacter sp.]